jgi:hypothetical protein
VFASAHKKTWIGHIRLRTDLNSLGCLGAAFDVWKIADMERIRCDNVPDAILTKINQTTG